VGDRLTPVSVHAAVRPRPARQAGLTLVELLVVMSITVVVTALLVMSWLALTKSYSMTTRTTEAGELARDAVSRLSREIRDAEPDPASGDPAIVDFGDDFIEFTTTFNQANNDQPLPTPILTRYEYRRDATTGEQTLHRLRDTNGDGLFTPSDRDDLVVTNLRNYSQTTAGQWQPVTKPFTYMKLNLEDREPMLAPLDTPSQYIALVQVHLLVKMPGRQPGPTDLVTTVQLRNQAQ
jgi:type II secretory pathway pseudopilin PulG